VAKGLHLLGLAGAFVSGSLSNGGHSSYVTP